MASNSRTLIDPPLLRTKVLVPQIPPRFVHRPRLTGQVNRGVQGPLTLITAPAGFGKTNLLIEWAEMADLPVAWYTIERDDNDFTRFFRYLIAALQTLEPGLGEEALDFIRSTKGGWEVGLTLLINEISTLPKELALVLDEFQVVEDPAILQGFNFLLRHLPPNLRLVIASRSEPDLDLAGLRLRGRIFELNAGDLRFNAEEVALFFQQAMGLQLSPQMVQSLERRTEGWISALQMAALSLRDQSDPAELLAHLEGDSHYLVDFLAEEVLDHQPEEVRRFLLRTSVLDTLTGPLCEMVARPDAQPGYGSVMLNRLERLNLFITALDEKHEWFRYHPLFADFLRHIQEENNPAEMPQLQKRAALWFEQNDRLDEAFRYALASGDVEWTADLIERNIQTMVSTGEIFSLTHWLGRLPDEIIHQRPPLSLAYAWGLIAAYRLDLARYWLDDLQRTLDQLEEQGGSSTAITEEDGAQSAAISWNIRGGLAICQATLAILSGDLDRAAELTRQATGYLKEDSPFIRSMIALDDSFYHTLSGDVPKAIEALRQTVRIARQANNLLVMVIATCQLADLQVLNGRLNQAWATLQKAQYMALGPDGEPLSLSGLVDLSFGDILLERNALEEAGEYLERGCRAIQSLWPLGRLNGIISLARLRQAQGDISGAREMIAKAAEIALSTESSRWDDTFVSGVAVRLALQRGDVVEAEKWWKRGGFPDYTGTIALENYPYHIFEYLLLNQARFLLVKGQDLGRVRYLQQASDLLESLLLEAERFERVTSQIQALVLLAMAQSALGNDRAPSTLLRALALGEPGGYRRIYLDEGPRLYELLLRSRPARQESGSYLPSLAFIDQLLEDIQQASGESPLSRPADPPQGAPPSGAGDALPAALSAREIEVLTLIAEGKSNQEISAELYLALNTVKRHAYNIYNKLGVKNRTQAVTRARHLGLIP